MLNIWVGTGSAALVSVFLLRRAPTPPSFETAGPTVAGAGLGVAVGVAMSAATWALYPISVELIPAIEVEVARLYALLRQTPGPVWAFPVLVLVVAAEELVWRGLAIDILSKPLGAVRAVVVSSLLYVLPQVAFRSPLLVVVAVLCGVVWGALRMRTQGLIAPFLAHLTWDLLVFILFPVG